MFPCAQAFLKTPSCQTLRPLSGIPRNTRSFNDGKYYSEKRVRVMILRLEGFRLVKALDSRNPSNPLDCGFTDWTNYLERKNERGGYCRRFRVLICVSGSGHYWYVVQNQLGYEWCAEGWLTFSCQPFATVRLLNAVVAGQASGVQLHPRYVQLESLSSPFSIQSESSQPAISQVKLSTSRTSGRNQVKPQLPDQSSPPIVMEHLAERKTPLSSLPHHRLSDMGWRADFSPYAQIHIVKYLNVLNMNQRNVMASQTMMTYCRLGGHSTDATGLDLSLRQHHTRTFIY
ncbi:hypothetical protein TNCV_676161 [Trichonephila clavipes]|nr:hypothetical protein TNCV_676161 [Trichonephila clavipes]